jgi:hypothetical protein
LRGAIGQGVYQEKQEIFVVVHVTVGRRVASSGGNMRVRTDCRPLLAGSRIKKT